MDSREDMGIENSEKSYGAADVSIQPSVEKEQGNTGAQDTVAGEGNAVVEKKADVPPNGGYGWVCVAACATINACVFHI
jgi:hypothetical protein